MHYYNTGLRDCTDLGGFVTNEIQIKNYNCYLITINYNYNFQLNEIIITNYIFHL